VAAAAAIAGKDWLVILQNGALIQGSVFYIQAARFPDSSPALNAALRCAEEP